VHRQKERKFQLTGQEKNKTRSTSAKVTGPFKTHKTLALLFTMIRFQKSSEKSTGEVLPKIRTHTARHKPASSKGRGRKEGYRYVS
jgi:hypothetical protein